MSAETYTKADADAYRERSRKCHQDAIDSFERCDTDGFLSQWASDQMSEKYRLMANLADEDGMWTFRTLGRNGALVPCREIKTRYGWKWGVYATFEDATNCGPIIEWVSIGKRGPGKGYEWISVRAEGVVDGTEGGLRVHWYVRPKRGNALTPDNCEIVKEES